MSTIIHEYPDGTVVRQEANWWTRSVETPTGRVFEFEESYQHPSLAHLWAELWYRTGGTRIDVDDDLIPVNVVSLGRPAIMAYMTVAHGADLEDIAEQFNVSISTVEQNLSHFKTGRR